MTKKNCIHLICNAHLDPVWLWRWPEGAAEAISTFRTAADICEGNKGFVFNHNEAILYQWIAEYDPALFARIRKLVRQKKWHIMGGWYLQPDCNMPSGESIIRHILTGKRFFKEAFGCDVSTAVNVDTFGHSRGLVQILAKSGYNGYLFGRPSAGNNLQLPADCFRWVGFDGSNVTAARFEFPYNNPPGQARKKLEQHIAQHNDEPVSVMLWGVGNHGGGPSRQDLKNLDTLIAATEDVAIVHSTPEAFIKDMHGRGGALAEFKDDLNPCMVGCYTSMAHIKRLHRQLENDLFAAEKAASAAAAEGLMTYPREEFDQALCDLLTSQFHDALPGTSIAPVEDDLRTMLGHGLNIVDRVRMRAFFALTAGQKKAAPGTIPVLVYNPHPYPVEQTVSCEFNLADMLPLDAPCRIDVYTGGKQVDAQTERQYCVFPMQWRKRVVFRAVLKPGQVNRFDCRVKTGDAASRPKRPTLKRRLTLGNARLGVTINTATGLVDDFRVDGKRYVRSGAFEPLALRDNADPWGMLSDRFDAVKKRFTLMSPKAAAQFAGVPGVLEPVRIIEDGPVRTVVEALFACGKSAVCQRYIIPKHGTEFELNMAVHWNFNDTLLKLQIPLRGKGFDSLGQTVCGVQRLPVDGTEAVSQRWNAMIRHSDNGAVSCINDGIYGSDVVGGQWRLSVLRSPVWAAHPSGIRRDIDLPEDRYHPRMDQGVHHYRFWFNAGDADKRLAAVDREAQIKNEQVTALACFPSGDGQKPKPLVRLSDNVIVVTAIKQAETKGHHTIVRLFEPTGKKRKTTIHFPVLGKRIQAAFGPFEIKTYRVNTRSGAVAEVDLMEKPLRRKSRR